MRKRMQGMLALGLASAMLLSMAGCGGSTSSGSSSAAGSSATASNTSSKENVTIKITWWGSQTRHDYTQKLLDLYTQLHPNVKFETSPAGWDGYFDKLSTQAASGSMPDIIQMDYLYITTYAKNNSIADLQSFIDDGTIDVSKIDKNILNTGKINNKMTGMVLSTSLLAIGYNPEVLGAAGVQAPKSSWTWNDFVTMSQKVKSATGKLGAAVGPVEDTNLLNYWIRQHGENLFSADNKSIGYKDDKVCADFLQMWKDMIDAKTAPNPDEYAQIAALGLEGGPVVKGDAAMTQNWNNYANIMTKANDKLKVITPPLANDSTGSKGLWMKPGMFFSVSETSKVKKEAAEFINWFINSKEANDIIMGERGTPVSSDIRDYLINSGKMTAQQKDMFQFVNDAASLCGTTPPPDPVGMSEVNKAFKDCANKAFYGQETTAQAATDFRKQANEILARNN